MDKNEYFKIKGYLNILECAYPNGRHNHRLANKITALRIHLKLDKPLTYEYEQEVKDLVNKVSSEFED